MGQLLEFPVPQEATARPLLRPGDTVWKCARADRAAVLVDAAAYFGALRDAMRRARHSIFIVGWDIDSRTKIVGPSGAAEDDGPETLGDFLGYLVGRRPSLDIYVLPWDWSLLFLRERELLPMVALGWRTPDRVHVCVDSTAPAGSSHHQKIVVIDDTVAFCGGLDLTLRRWDTASHDCNNPARTDPSGTPYDPYHDLQMIVDGDAARALGTLTRTRWAAASDTEAKAASDETPAPWPDSVKPDFENVDVGIARTCPVALDRPCTDEVEKLYFRAIAAAERLIYIENQYLNCDDIARALVERAETRPDLEIVVVSNQDSGGWLEERTMGVGRRRFITTLQNSPAADRIRVLRSTVTDGGDPCEVHIHAKLMIVDDRLFRIGSSNLNNRSMGFDTECDLAIEAGSEVEASSIARLRSHLIAHHLGVTPAALDAAVERRGSLIAAIESLGPNDHALVPIDPNHPAPLLGEDVETTIADAADPKVPPAHAAIAAAAALQEEDDRSSGIPIRVVTAAVLALAFLGLWYFSPVSDYADVKSLEPHFERIAESGWAPVAVPLIIVIASIAFFPVTILIALTGMTLGPVLGAACAIAGCLGSAILSFGIGTLLGENGLRRIMGKKLNKVSKRIAKTGILSVAGLRLLPVAPFTAINLIAGASHIRFGDYVTGTILGMVPGIVLMTALGDRLREVWRNPSAENMTVLGLIVVAWLAVAFGVQYFISRHRARRQD